MLLQEKKICLVLFHLTQSKLIPQPGVHHSLHSSGLKDLPWKFRSTHNIFSLILVIFTFIWRIWFWKLVNWGIKERRGEVWWYCWHRCFGWTVSNCCWRWVPCARNKQRFVSISSNIDVVQFKLLLFAIPIHISCTKRKKPYNLYQLSATFPCHTCP